MRRPSRRLYAGAGAALVLTGGFAVTDLTSTPSARPLAAGLSEAPAAAAPSAVAPVAPIAVAPPITATRLTATTDASLTSAVRARMARSTSRRYSVVVDVAGVGRVVDINGASGLLPASTEKLFTTLPLLQRRPQDRLVTTVGAARAPSGGVLHGDLVVRASGDPTVMGSTLIQLAKQVRAHGVRKVTGRLVLNIGSLSLGRTRVGWKRSYIPSDVGPLSPFPVHLDTWRTSTSYLSNPTGGNLALMRAKLAKAGVHIVGRSVVARSGSTAVVLASHTSAPVASIVGHTLRWSVNFNAEQLLTVGGGMSPVDAAARAAGASGTATDGSGLSLLDRRTAHSEVALLNAAQRGEASSLLMSSLAVACRSGTLEHEMCHTSAAGKVWAKTGTLDHVKSLAGYTIDGAGRLVTFAFLTNGDVSTYKAMNAIERSVIVLRHYGG